MTISSGELYAIAGVLLFLIIIIVISYCIWYKKWRVQHSEYKYKNFNEKEHQYVAQRTPKIKVNTVEFTVPESANNRQFTWTEDGSNEFEYYLDENLRQKSLNISDNPSDKDSLKNSQRTRDSVKPSGVKTMVGHLKPELYNSDEQDNDLYEELPSGNIGRVWFSLEYDAQSEKLIVTVDRIRNLPGREKRSSLSLSTNSTCDPFIRLYLLPDEKRYLQSKMKRKTINPVFTETFMFTMSYNLLIERILRITVFDVDRFMRQTIIGHVIEPLGDLDITMATELWRDVEKSSQPSNNCGRLQVGLTHFPALNRVAVNLIRGQNIGSEDIPKPDCYVKITYSMLNKVHKVKKSSVHKCTNDPFFNQTVEFKIDRTGMDIVCLSFEVFHNTPAMVKNDKPLGSFIVGGSLCTRGKELEHWENMTQKPQTVVKEWHDLRL